METTTLADFAQAARTLARAARQREHAVPTFRCPPTLPVDRSIRRTRNGAVVAVRVKGRPFVAVAADMIEGIIVTNRLSGPDALRVRGALWAALGFSVAASEAPATTMRRVA
jgi:hypothetical protein